MCDYSFYANQVKTAGKILWITSLYVIESSSYAVPLGSAVKMMSEWPAANVGPIFDKCHLQSRKTS